jgi:exonuclease III
MKIGTWNVEYADAAKLDNLRGVLTEHDADIWVLTETHDELVPPACEHVVHAAPRPKNWWRIRPGSRWVSIWSKYPMKNVTLPDADQERTVAALVEGGTAGRVLVYGTVMPWKDDRQIAGWAEHHRVIPLQSAEWRELQETYPDVSLCVAGDWNTDMESGRRYGTKLGIAAIQEGMRECGLFCATAPLPGGPPILATLPIDHIALPLTLRDQTRVVSAWPADKVKLSDHSGMVVEVQIT